MWSEGRFDLFVSIPILEEYKRALEEFGLKKDPELVQKWINMFLAKTFIVATPASVRQWSRDCHDDMFIDCALASEADYLVTGDRDLLDLKGKLDLEIVTPMEFLQLLKSP